MGAKNFTDKIQDLPLLGLIEQASQQLDYPVYLVGGYVRDLLIQKPGKDIDLVCQGSGVQLAQTVASLISEETKVSVFKNFGTAMLNYQGYEFEFVGARKESYRRSSRKPIVEDGTLEDDQKRRDFTINAMAISLNRSNYGELIDPFEGVQDLNRKVIRTPLDPAVTFSDDPLRMMRAIRFAAQLNFDIEIETFDAIRANATRLEIVSNERIVEELNKIILTDKPSYGFKLLFTSGLLNQFFPTLVRLHGVEKRDNMAHKDNFYHTLKVLDNISEAYRQPMASLGRFTA